MTSRRAVLGIEGGAFFYGASRVFSGMSFLLDDARTALVGENGVSKSTLLKCLAGELELNAGKIVRSRGLRLGVLPQEIPPTWRGLPCARCWSAPWRGSARRGRIGGSTSSWPRSAWRRTSPVNASTNSPAAGKD